MPVKLLSASCTCFCISHSLFSSLSLSVCLMLSMHDEVINFNRHWLKLTHSEALSSLFASSHPAISVPDARTAANCGSVFTQPTDKSTRVRGPLSLKGMHTVKSSRPELMHY